MEPLAQTPFALSELVVDNWLILTVHHLQSEQLARKRVDVHGDFRDFLCMINWYVLQLLVIHELRLD